MKTWKVVLEFTTTHSLGQEAAQEFWARGDRFHSTGARQYEWMAFVDAEDLYSAIVHVTAAACTVVVKSGLSTQPDIIGLTIDREDSTATPDRAPEAANSV